MTTTIDLTELERLHQQHAYEGVNAVARAFARHMRGKFDAETNNAMRRGLEQLIEDKLINRVAKEGDRVPDFELPNGGGKSVRFRLAPERAARPTGQDQTAGRAARGGVTTDTRTVTFGRREEQIAVSRAFRRGQPRR